MTNENIEDEDRPTWDPNDPERVTFNDLESAIRRVEATAEKEEALAQEKREATAEFKAILAAVKDQRTVNELQAGVQRANAAAAAAKQPTGQQAWEAFARLSPEERAKVPDAERAEIYRRHSEDL
jgi:hypothetical protein